VGVPPDNQPYEQLPVLDDLLFPLDVKRVHVQHDQVVRSEDNRRECYGCPEPVRPPAVMI